MGDSIVDMAARGIYLSGDLVDYARLIDGAPIALLGVVKRRRQRRAPSAVHRDF
jgi:hypothetical protein